MWDFETGENVLSYIVHNLPSGIEKLDLSCHQINDQFLSALIARCKNLRSLKLSDFTLTNDFFSGENFFFHQISIKLQTYHYF